MQVSLDFPLAWVALRVATAAYPRWQTIRCGAHVCEAKSPSLCGDALVGTSMSRQGWLHTQLGLVTQMGPAQSAFLKFNLL